MSEPIVVTAQRIDQRANWVAALRLIHLKTAQPSGLYLDMENSVETIKRRMPWAT